MERRGIVMEVQDQTAIVMTNHGEFCSLPIQTGMDVGVEVSWSGYATSLSNSGQRSRRFLRGTKLQRMAAAGLAACVALAVGVWQGIEGMRPAQAYAYVSLDINPSVKFTVNRHLQVVSVVPSDGDGRALLMKADVHSGEPLRQAINEIVNAAVEAKMVPRDGTILIAAAPGSRTDIKSSDVERVQAEAQSDVKSALQTNQSGKDLKATVFSFGLSQNVWNAVDKAGISPGKFAAVLAAQQSGVHVNINQLSGKQTGKLLRQALESSNNNSATVTVSNDGDDKKVNDLVAEVKSGKQVGLDTHASAVQTLGGSVSVNADQSSEPFVVTPNPKKSVSGHSAGSSDQQPGATGPSSPGTGKTKEPVGKGKGNGHDNGSGKGKGNEQSNGKHLGKGNSKGKGNGHNNDHESNGSGGQGKGKSNHQDGPVNQPGVGIPAEVGNLVENTDGNTVDNTPTGNGTAIAVGGSVSVDNHGSKDKNKRDHAPKHAENPKKSQDSTSGSNPGKTQSGSLNGVLGNIPNAPTSFGSGNVSVGNFTNSDGNGLQGPDRNTFASNDTNGTNPGHGTGNGKVPGKNHGKHNNHQLDSGATPNNGGSGGALDGNSTSSSGGNLLGNLSPGSSTGVTGAQTNTSAGADGSSKQNHDQAHHVQGKDGQKDGSNDRGQSHGQSSKKQDSGLHHSRQSNAHPSQTEFGSDFWYSGQPG